MIHFYFDQLTEDEQNVIGEAYDAMHKVLLSHNSNMFIVGDDTAERVVDAIAKGIIETRNSEWSLTKESVYG